MQEAAARFFITPIIMVATSTTIAALGLEQQKLTFSLDALVTGNAAMGEIDYLIECPHVCMQPLTFAHLPIKRVSVQCVKHRVCDVSLPHREVVTLWGAPHRETSL